MTKKPVPVYSVLSIPAGYAVCCDGVVMQTPRGNGLIVPPMSLADVIAEELRHQPVPRRPFMQLAATAIDIVGKDPARIRHEILRYAETELLCHRADEGSELAVLQNQNWQPILDWCALRYGARLQAGVGCVPIRQSTEALAALRTVLDGFDNFRLTGLRQVVDVSGSLVLGLALVEKHLTAEQVFEAAELDASFQITKWGEDPATTKHREGILRDLVLCEQWFGFLAVGE